jgi:hypothetical protein
LARDASTAVVIRRGPSKKVAVIGWDRETDEFTVGQWMKGRIYERRCDVSPDGKHFIYFAMNGHWDSETQGAWTAVSRAPYLKALTLIPQGDCWLGGGTFLSSSEYWFNRGYQYSLLRDESGLSCNLEYPWPERYGYECTSVYYPRLLRDGWLLQHREPTGAGDRIALFEKNIDEQWTIHKIAHQTNHNLKGKGCYFDEHMLRNRHTQVAVECPSWEWAEVDGDRLVWAEYGKLFSGRLDANGLIDVKELLDFNTLQYEELEAPY